MEIITKNNPIKETGCCPDKVPQNEIININWWLTTGCNFKCKYCYETEVKNKPILNTNKEIAKQVLNWLVDERISGKQTSLSINFFGGEPLLLTDIIEYCLIEAKKLKSKTGKQIKFSMTTNASLLTDQLIDFYSFFDMGYLISIDGKIETLTKWRGIPNDKNNQDLVSKVIENSKIVLKYKPETTARITLPNDEIKNLYSNVMFLYSIGFNNISAHIITDGEGEITKEGINEYKNQLNLMYDWFKSFLIRNKDIPYSTVAKLLKNNFSNWLEKSPCGAGRGFMGISPDGGVYPCHRFVQWEEWKLGTVFDYTLDKEKRDLFLNFKRKNIKKCSECPSKTCSFQCYASNYAKYKDIFAVNQDFCEIKKSEEEIATLLITDKDIIKMKSKIQNQGDFNENYFKGAHKVYPSSFRR